MADFMIKHHLSSIGDPGYGWKGCGICNVPVPTNMYTSSHTSGKKHQTKSKGMSEREILHTSGTWIKCNLCNSVQPNMEAAKIHTQRRNHKARMKGERPPYIASVSKKKKRSKSRTRGGGAIGGSSMAQAVELRIKQLGIRRGTQTAMRDGLARTFHYNCSRQPLAEVEKCMPSFQLIWGNMLDFMVFDRVEHTGSAFEKTNVGPDVEFDTIVVRRCNLKHQPTKEGGTQSLLLRESTWTDTTGQMMSLRSDEMLNKMKSGLQKFINSIQQGKQAGLSGSVKVTIIDHTNATSLQLDVESLNGAFQKYSMDISPALELPNFEPNSILIPVYRNPVNEREALEWKFDYAVDEKNLLRHGDENNGCRREVYRVCKAIRNRDPQLKKLRSYVIKSMLLRMMSLSRTHDWSRDDLGERVHDVMIGLRDGIRAGDIRARFNPGENVVERLNVDQRNQLVNHLTKLLGDDSKMFLRT